MSDRMSPNLQAASDYFRERNRPGVAAKALGWIGQAAKDVFGFVVGDVATPAADWIYDRLQEAGYNPDQEDFRWEDVPDDVKANLRQQAEENPPDPSAFQSMMDTDRSPTSFMETVEETAGEDAGRASEGLFDDDNDYGVLGADDAGDGIGRGLSTAPMEIPESFASDEEVANFYGGLTGSEQSALFERLFGEPSVHPDGLQSREQQMLYSELLKRRRNAGSQ